MRKLTDRHVTRLSQPGHAISLEAAYRRVPKVADPEKNGYPKVTEINDSMVNTFFTNMVKIYTI